MSYVWLAWFIINLCWLHTDPVWFSQFLPCPELTQNLRVQLMKLSPPPLTFKYIKSILTHICLLVPFLFSKFPPWKFQWCSSTSFCVMSFRIPRWNSPGQKHLAHLIKLPGILNVILSNLSLLILLSEVYSCFSGLTSISLDRR